MFAAVRSGDAKKLAELMGQDPGFDVNMDQDGRGKTLLHITCCDDHTSPMIPLLLAHPEIDANVKDMDGCTPFYLACSDENAPCVREMLKDSRVNVNELNKYGCAPLRKAVRWGHPDIIKWWIASGRKMDLGKPGDVYRTDAIGLAKLYRKMEIATLLERFKEKPVKTRHAVRVELDWYNEAAAEVFAVAVFVSGGLLQIKDTTLSPAARFFSIARRLPLELQMVLCFRQVGSAKVIIQGKESEVAFKELAKRLLWSSLFIN